MEINEASRRHTISEEARAAVAEADAVIREARRRQRRRQFRTGCGAVLALACAVAGYAMAAGDGSRPPARTVTGAGQQRAGGPATARAVQRAAGRYWVTSGTVGNFLRVGPAGDPYLVLEEVGVQSWAARSPREGSPYLAQALWARPASPSDQAAWRRGGSPTEWKQIGQDTALADPYGVPGDARLLPLSAAPGKLTAGWATYGSQPFLVGDKALSLRRLLALPADPARLKELLLTGSSDYPRVSQSAYLLQAVPPVLQMPVTPAVRSALYRMLAALPGIQSLGTVKDVSGKHGAAVAYAGRYANCGNGMSRTAARRVLFTSCTVQQVLVIDPATGLPQAEELRYTQLPPGQKWPAPSGLFSYEIFGRSHWTNHNRPRV